MVLTNLNKLNPRYSSPSVFGFDHVFWREECFLNTSGPRAQQLESKSAIYKLACNSRYGIGTEDSVNVEFEFVISANVKKKCLLETIATSIRQAKPCPFCR